jgi:hypothetical protein
MLRRTVPTLLIIGMLASGAVLSAVLGAVPGARADEDPGRQARLLVADGKFEEADTVLDKADEAVRTDPELRWSLAQSALKWSKRKRGMDRVKGYEAARDHFAAVMKKQPDNGDAALGAVDAALELVSLWTEAKNGAMADQNRDWAIAAAEEAFAGGVESQDLKGGVAELYASRAGRVATIDEIDKLSKDYRRAAELYIAAAAGSRREGELLGKAADCRLREAQFVRDKIPKSVEEEVRDEEAIKAAVDLATKACQAKGANTASYSVQLRVLRLAAQWEVKDLPEPFMEEYPRLVEGLKLQLPKSEGWKKAKYEGWDLLLNRKFEGEDTKYVQLMIRRLHWDDSRFSGLSWADIEKVAERKHESEIENFEEEPLVNVEAVNLSGKDENDVWHYRIKGTKKGRQLYQAEWFWKDPDKKNPITYNLKILDYDAPFGMEEPDVLKFIESACGQMLTPKQKPSKKKKKKKKKKKRKKKKK